MSVSVKNITLNKQYDVIADYVCTQTNTDIYIFNKSDLAKSGVYQYSGGSFADKVTCIAFLEKNYFLLGQGNKVAVCSTGSGKFGQISEFSLDGDKNDKNHEKHAVVNGIDNLVRQGMCAHGSRLYKVYGKRNEEGQIITNYIVEWTMSGGRPDAPAYNSCTMTNMYEFTPKSDWFLFEMESVSRVGSEIYVAVKTQKDSESSLFKAWLYKVSGMSV